MKIPNKRTIESVMHPFPFSIGASLTVDKAIELMQEHNIRHLPVQDAGKLVGIITDRDINFALRIDNCEPEHLRVRDVHTADPYAVTPDTPVYQVAAKMAHDHIGCALVVDKNNLVGIFTTVDACRLLSEVLADKLEQ